MNVLSWPAIVALEIISACNNLCPGCSNVYAAKRQGRVTPAATWERWLNSFAPEAVQLRLTGGEPSLHPEFQRIFDAATRYEAWVTVFTNGRWRDPEAFLGGVRGRGHFSGLLISLHGARPETHEAFSGVPGSFHETLTNIRKAVDAGVTVAVSTVLTRRSAGEIDEVAALAQALGAQHTAFNRYIGPPDDQIEPSPEQMRQALDQIEALAQAGAPVRYGVGVPQCSGLNSSEGCLAGAAYASIDPWGRVRPCAHSPSLVGSLAEASLSEIWHGARMNAWRGLVPDECTTCAAYGTCHGGCRAVQELRPDRRDPLRGEPLASFRPAQPARKLAPGLRPRAACRLRPEAFGYAALGGGQVLAVRPGARQVILACDGQRTLGELAGQFGPGSVTLIGALLERGLLAAD